MTTYEKNSSKHNKHGDLLTVREVARKLRVNDTTVRRWINAGALDAISLPHRGKKQAWRIRRDTMDTLLGEQGA